MPTNRNASTTAQLRTGRCRCGGVEFEAIGAPIVSSVCYCADCQKGARLIEELPNADAVCGDDGGTPYILFRKDRFSCSKGASLLKSYKLKAESPTNRVVASCCNSAMFANFDKGPFWVSVYSSRFLGELPPLEMRMCTKSKPSGVVVPSDVPSSPGYPLVLMLKLLRSGLAMRFRL
jgi:hypothetical protein